MITTNPKIIKLTTLHHPEYRLTQRYGWLDKKESCDAHQVSLMKYFPKYYKRLFTQISLEDWAFLSKLRQIKTIEHFESPQISAIPIAKQAKRFSNLAEKIFRNKRKSAKSLPLFNTRGLALKYRAKPQISRFVPNITSLNLLDLRDLNSKDNENIFMDKTLEKETLWCYYNFWESFRKLKHLELSNVTSYSWFVINQINSAPHFLSRLKTLKFSLNFRLKPGDLKHARNVLLHLIKNRHFLEHLTHINCEEFDGHQYYDGLISNLLALCPNLVSLNFHIGSQASRSPSPAEIYKECQDTEVLKQIGKMVHLQEVTVSVYGIKTFIKRFSFPKSVQKIVVIMIHSFYDPALLDLFDSEFFERWRELPRLHTLKIKMRRTAKSNDLLHKFVLPLLEMTSNLKSFSLELGPSPAFQNSKCEELDLSLFNERILALKKLESFEVSNCSAVKNYFLNKSEQLLTINPKTCQFLSNLIKLSIEGDFSQEFGFQSFLLLYSSSETLSKKSLKFATLTFKTIEGFNDCIKVANRAVSLGNLELEIKIILPVNNIEEALSSFGGPVVLGKGLRILLDISVKSSRFSRNMDQIIEPHLDSLKRIFGDIKVEITKFR